MTCVRGRLGLCQMQHVHIMLRLTGSLQPLTDLFINAHWLAWGEAHSAHAQDGVSTMVFRVGHVGDLWPLDSRST